MLGASELSASIDDGGPGGRALSLAHSPALAIAGVFALGHGTLVVEVADAELRRSNLMFASSVQVPPNQNSNSNNNAGTSGTPNRHAHKTDKQLLKSRRSFVERLIEHQVKLKEYITDPYKCDNLGLLKRARNQQEKQSIMNSRIIHLNDEIKNFTNEIRAIDEVLNQRGIVI